MSRDWVGMGSPGFAIYQLLHWMLLSSICLTVLDLRSKENDNSTQFPWLLLEMLRGNIIGYTKRVVNLSAV